MESKVVFKERDYHPQSEKSSITYDDLRSFVLNGVLGEVSTSNKIKNILSLVGAGTLLYIGFKLLKNFAIMRAEIGKALRS